MDKGKEMRANLISLVIAALIGGGAGYGHIQSAYMSAPEVRHIEVIPYVAEAEIEEEVEFICIDDSIPDEIEIAAEKYGAEYGISPEILEAMAFYESTFRPEVDNGNCKGLMMINIKFHKSRMERLGVTDLHDADQNMHVAADYLSELIDEYGDTVKVLSKYSGSTTDKYAKKVLKLATDLEVEHEKIP